MQRNEALCSYPLKEIKKQEIRILNRLLSDKMSRMLSRTWIQAEVEPHDQSELVQQPKEDYPGIRIYRQHDSVYSGIFISGRKAKGRMVVTKLNIIKKIMKEN